MLRIKFSTANKMVVSESNGLCVVMRDQIGGLTHLISQFSFYLFHIIILVEQSYSDCSSQSDGDCLVQGNGLNA